MQPTDEQRYMRRTGIDLVRELPWGAHICLFYETPKDLIEALADYFAAGLEAGEFCIWALSDPITREDAIRHLRKSIDGFDDHLKSGNIELIPGYDWYLDGDEFDPQRIIRKWFAKLGDALAKGFSGIRVSGNAFWFETSIWSNFLAYEEELDQTLVDHKLVALCTYSLQACRAVDVLEVARAHQFSIARRNGRWEFLQTPELAVARREIRRASDGCCHILWEELPGLDLLTSCERVALQHVVKGSSSKEAARTLGISHRTVEFHRANIMRKLGARNIPDLIGRVLGKVDGQ